MFWTVDRIEDGVAVVELAPDLCRSLPLSALPPGVREGDVLRVTVDPALTRMRRDRQRRRLSRLIRRNPMPR